MLGGNPLLQFISWSDLSGGSLASLLSSIFFTGVTVIGIVSGQSLLDVRYGGMIICVFVGILVSLVSACGHWGIANDYLSHYFEKHMPITSITLDYPAPTIKGVLLRHYRSGVLLKRTSRGNAEFISLRHIARVEIELPKKQK
jgi:hypothetical protein